MHAARINSGRHARILREQNFWADNVVSARLNDGILNDWNYTTLPLSILVIHRLTETIRSVDQRDPSRAAFFTHWVSHYVSDSLWVNHVFLRYRLPHLMPEDRKHNAEFDNGIERQLEDLIGKPDYFPAPIEPWNRGFWSSFWSVLALVERNRTEYYRKWQEKADYLSFARHNIILAVKVFENYLRYLDLADGIEVADQAAMGRRIQRIYCAQQEWMPALYAIQLHLVLDEGDTISDAVLTNNRDEADLVVEHGSTPQISTQNGKTILGADELSLGPVIDHFLFARKARFGLPKSTRIHPSWPGNCILEGDRTGKELQDTIFSEATRRAFRERRGYEISEIFYEPDKLIPKSREMRDEWLAAHAEWTRRWSDCLAKGFADDKTLCL